MWEQLYTASSPSKAPPKSQDMERKRQRMREYNARHRERINKQSLEAYYRRTRSSIIEI